MNNEKEQQYTQERLDDLIKERLDDHETRIRAVERLTLNNNLVISAMKWVAVTIAGSSIAVIIGIIGETVT